MALLGNAALAMWWHVTPGMLDEFEDWHSHEHFVERLGIPGFLRASRWKSADGSGAIFVMYELTGHEVLSSSDYLQRLNAPSAWSTAMMPHHHGMVRSQCRVLASRGGAVAGHAATLRVSAAVGRDDELERALAATLDQLATRPGLAGMHLLRHERPPIAQTTEQKIRGGDREADRVVVLVGYEAQAVRDAIQAELQAGTWSGELAAAPEVGHYVLAHSATPPDTV